MSQQLIVVKRNVMLTTRSRVLQKNICKKDIEKKETHYINVRTGTISVMLTVAVDFQLSLKFSKLDNSPGGASFTSNNT